MENRKRFGLDKMNDELVNDILPVEINLPKNQKNLLATLIYISGIDKKDKDGFFYVDNKYLMEVLGVSEPTIISNANKLIEEGFIQRVTGKKNHPSKYLITDLIKEYTKEYTKKYTKNFSKNFSKTVENFSQDKDIEEDIDKDIEEEKDNIKYNKNNNNIINTGKSMREPNVELMSNLIKSIESIKESLQLMNSSIKENSNKIETINETLQLMNSTNSDNFNKLINKIDSLKDSSIKVSKEREILTEETTNSSSDEETVKEQSNKESETTNNNKPSTVEKEKEKGCAEREKETAQDAFKSNPEASNDMDGIVDHTDENKPKLPYFKEWKKFDSEEEFLEECDTIINLTSKEHFQKNYYTDFSEYAIKSKTSYDLEGGKAVKRINKKVDADKELDKELKISTAKVIDTTPKANDTKVISKEETVELPSNTVHFHTQEEMSSYIHSHKLTLVENWEKYKINFDNLTISPKGNSVEQKENESIKETVQAETSGISQNLIDIIEFAEKSNKSKSDTSNTADGIVDHTGENKPNLPIPNEPTEDELKFEKRKQKAKELVSRLINEHMTNEQEFNEYFNKGFMWCKKFQLETYYVKLVEKYKPDVDTTEVEEEYALNDIFSNAA